MGSSLSLLLSVLVASDAWNLQPVLDEIRDRQDVPGISVVVTQQNEVMFAGASGLADLETGRKMTPDTVLYAGSLSKVLTAVLTLQLVETGKLSLDDVVPGIAARSNADVRLVHLLSHTSGLEQEGHFDYWFSARFPDDTSLANYLVNAELLSAPGETVRYSNIGYAALGPIIAEATGQDYSQALRERVLVPLGMTSSGGGRPGDSLSAGYTPPNRVLPNTHRPFAGVGRAVGERRIREYHDANAMTPAFGLFTSANDLGRLARMLLGFGNSRILSNEMRLAMLTARVGKRGLGIRLERLNGRPVARHGGWFAAHRSHLLLDLRSSVSVVVMANGDNASPDAIAEKILATALAHLERDSD
jgi:CubicO group peptidase (beta-lactamase class C family)